MDLEGSVCLVTGASSGIGRAVALELIARGAVVAASARRLEILEELGAASVHRADLSDPAHALALAEEVEARHGRVDVLINNAGVRADGAVGEVELDGLDASFQVNVLSPFVLCGRLGPAMAERGAGVIVNVEAPAVAGGRRGMGAYAASKAALASLTQSLRQEIGGGRGVAVFGFDPGWVRTGLAPDGTGEPADAAGRLAQHIVDGRSSRTPLV